MNEAQVLERLTTQYASLPAPTPSAALLARMDSGRVGEDDDTANGAVVVPLSVRRPRARVRYLVAAVVAGFVLFSGLAAAGALPAPVQREVSALVSHVGIDIPSPDDGHAPARTPDRHQRPGASARSGDSSGAGAGAATENNTTLAPSGSTASPAPSGDGTTGGVLGGIGGIAGGVTSTTLAPTGNLDLPPVTVPGLPEPTTTLAPITVPGLPLPSATLPPLPILGL